MTALKINTTYHSSLRALVNKSTLAWWAELLQSKLVGFSVDEATGYRLDSRCQFKCPHRHFSHLLQLYDLECADPASPLALRSIDHYFGVTCNASNWHNEECRVSPSEHSCPRIQFQCALGTQPPGLFVVWHRWHERSCGSRRCRTPKHHSLDGHNPDAERDVWRAGAHEPS